MSARRSDRARGGACFGVLPPRSARAAELPVRERQGIPFYRDRSGARASGALTGRPSHTRITRLLLSTPWATLMPVTVSTRSSRPDRNAAAFSSLSWTPRPPAASSAAQLRLHPASVSAPAVAPRVPSAWSLAWPHLPPFRTAVTPATLRLMALTPAEGRSFGIGTSRCASLVSPLYPARGGVWRLTANPAACRACGSQAPAPVIAFIHAKSRRASHCSSEECECLRRGPRARQPPYSSANRGQPQALESPALPFLPLNYARSTLCRPGHHLPNIRRSTGKS